MATTRMQLDVEGKNIIDILSENMGTLFDDVGGMGPKHASDEPAGSFTTNDYFAEGSSYVTKYYTSNTILTK